MGKDIIHIEGLLNDASNIIEQAKRTAYAAVNVTLVARNWLLGKRIAEEDMHGMQRAEYGKQVIKTLSEYLTEKYGEGFGTINLWHFVNFHKRYSTLFTLDKPSSEIVYTPCKESQDGIIYTALHDNDQLFAAKYLTYMPTKEELRREIEQQKQIFEMKQKNATQGSSFENKEDEA